jgi:hypothetical protein
MTCTRTHAGLLVVEILRRHNSLLKVQKKVVLIISAGSFSPSIIRDTNTNDIQKPASRHVDRSNTKIMLPHLFRRFPSSSSSSQRLKLSTSSRTNVIFGANTDVGKTVVTAGLIRASGDGTNYIKPLQCGGSDQRFIEKHAPNTSSTTTLYEWVTPASPHYAARFENKPVSDVQVLTSLQQYLGSLDGNLNWIETAGGVLSPSSSSPENRQPHHARDKELSWGWVTQADLYRPLIGSTSVVLIGDGRLGGIR